MSNIDGVLLICTLHQNKLNSLMLYLIRISNDLNQCFPTKDADTPGVIRKLIRGILGIITDFTFCAKFKGAQCNFFAEKK